MEIPLIYAVAPSMPPIPIPDGIAVGSMGFSLCSQRPFFRPPASAALDPGDWILLPDSDFPAAEQIPDCIEEIRRYLSFSRPAGVFLDFEAPPDRVRRELAGQLDLLLDLLQIPLIVPEPYIPATAHAMACIPARLLGGTLEGRLTEAVEHYPSGVCLELILGAVLMELPCLHGDVQLCSLEKAVQLAQEKSASIHHSEAFCCDYFLFSENKTAYCVLLDTRECLEEKYQLAQRCGVRLCIGLASELGGIWGKKDSLPQ